MFCPASRQVRIWVLMADLNIQQDLFLRRSDVVKPRRYSERMSASDEWRVVGLRYLAGNIMFKNKISVIELNYQPF